jgi:hypothetical protein
MIRSIVSSALALAVLVAEAHAKSVQIFVATNGDDGWSGQLEKPTPDRRDGPVATIQAALKLVRDIRRSGAKGPDEVIIMLRGGTHSIRTPVLIQPEHTGESARASLRIEAYRKETPILSGGVNLTGWSRVPGDTNLWQAPVPDIGRGAWAFHQLFINGNRKQRARSPNTGFFQIEGEYLSDKPTKFKYRRGDIRKSWADAGDVEVTGLQKWIDYRQPIVAIDEANDTVTLAGSIAAHTREPNARYYVENARDALDSPGEWFLDRARGVVLYWPEPGENLKSADIIVPALESELIRIEGDFAKKRPVRNLTLRGFTFACTDWNVGTNGYTDTQAAVGIHGDIIAEGAVDCSIEDCTFARLAGYGLELGRGCQRFRITGNEFVDLGAGGIRLGEPAKRTDASEQNFGHVVSDNHLHRLGRVFAPAVGVIIFQSGKNQIAHNHIHDLYYTAVSVGWNWGYQETPCRENVIEFNRMHHIGQGMLSDMGGVYTLGIQKGTVIRNNLIHDVMSHGYGGWGLYTDEGSTEILLQNNIVYRCKSAGFHQHYGRDNVIRNNIFAFGREHQLMRSREESHNSFVFERNIVYLDSGDVLGSYWSNNNFRIDHNVYFDTRTGAAPEAMKFAGVPLKEWQSRGHDRNSIIADPRFVDASRNDFRLKVDSPALKIGFEPIDASDIGIRRKYRKQVHDTEP